MGMVFCRGCGKEIHESAPVCPHCGAPQKINNSASISPTSKNTPPLPDGIKGWSWGAFLLNWIWAIGNKTWIGLLALIPYVNIVMAIILGIKGREWAWRNQQWDSVEHFNRVQRKWSIWGGVLVLVSAVIGLVLAVAIPAYKDYQAQEAAAVYAKQVEAERLAYEAKELEARRLAELEAKRQAELAAVQQAANVSIIEIHLLEKPEFSEEGIYLKTEKGSATMYAVNAQEQVRNAFSKAEKGQCLRLETVIGFDFSDASGIKRVDLCQPGL